MIESQNHVRVTISEEIMLARLAQSEQMREFFIEMWKQNPNLAKQGGVRVQALLTPLGRVDAKEMGSEPSGMKMTKQRGISLVELIMFIVIVSVALAGILLVMNVTTRSSADPVIHKQALAIAESLLEEVELMPFTYCDPDDANAASAVAATGGCAVAANEESTTIGPEAGETRYSATTPFDNISDYHGFDSTADGGIKDITNNAVAALSGYSASISVSASNLPNVTAGDALLIAVMVTGPDGTPVVVDGVRTRYAPRTTP